MRYLLLVLMFFAGCSAPEYKRPDWGDSTEPWNTTYLIDIDYSTVDLDEEAERIDNHYWDYAQLEGVTLEPMRYNKTSEHPDGWDTGGDSGIFTGTALAAWTFKWGTTKHADSKEEMLRTLRAVWMLTHAPGRGVLCRVTFPVEDGPMIGYPERWESRMGFVGLSAGDLPDPLGGTLPQMRYYTRATKDQLTGLLLGLSVCLKIAGPEIEEVRDIVRQCARDIYDHLKKHDWNIRDEKGENDTGADHVDGLLKTQLLALMAATDPTFQDEYEEEFVISDLGDWFAVFSNYSQYYAWNLRYSRALSIWILEENVERREEVAEFVEDCLWNNTSEQMSAWFAVIQAAIHSDVGAKGVMIDSLKSLAVKPLRNYSSPYAGQQYAPNVFEVLFGMDDKYVLPPHLRKPTGYTTWQKRPWDVSSSGPAKMPAQEATGLDFILVYWMARYFGLL
jgi:hypothetical protein